MANHYLLVGVTSRDTERESATETTEENIDYMSFEGELLNSEVVEIYNQHRADKDGECHIYSIFITSGAGDMDPVIIQIETAWKAPSAQFLGKISDWLCRKFFLIRETIAWCGHDPATKKATHLECAKEGP